MAPETEPLDVLTIGETVVDFISVEKTDTLSNASTFERHLGGSPANIAVYISKLGGRSAIVTKFGSDYFGEYVEDQLQHHGVNTEAVSRTDEAATTNAFVTRTVSIPDFQVNRGADALLAVRFAHEVASLKLRVEGHVERMIDRESLYASLESTGQRVVSR
jgi:uncharacterized UPF0146 family protein